MKALELFNFLLRIVKERITKLKKTRLVTDRDIKWRLRVIARDRRCLVNGCIDTHLIAHHILSHRDNPEGRYNLDNGATLCKKHHAQFHSKYGNEHFNRDNLIEFTR